MCQLDRGVVVLQQRRQPAANPVVQPHARTGRIRLEERVPLGPGDCRQRQLVVVPQEQRRLARLGQVVHRPDDIDDRKCILVSEREEEPRHEWKVEGHVAFVTLAEIGPHFRGTLVHLGKEDPAFVSRIHVGADLFQELVRLGQVVAARPLPLEQMRHGVETEAVDSDVEPEPHDLQHRGSDVRIVEIEVRLMVKEPVPVECARHRIPGPVRRFDVAEDDTCTGIPLIGVAPYIELALGRAGGCAARRLEPRVPVRRVIDDELRDDLQPSRVSLVEEPANVLERAVLRMHALVMRDVIAVVAQRRFVEGQQPQAGDAEAFEVIELLHQAREITNAIAVRVEEGLDVQLVDDRVLVPERIADAGGLMHAIRCAGARACRRESLEARAMS